MNPQNPSFVTTNWSMVSNATADGPTQRHAWTRLLKLYWYPCYAFACRQGIRTHDAEDVIQQFFVWLIEAEVLERASQDRGRFRTFMLVSLKQFIARDRRYQKAKKRDPGKPVVDISSKDSELQSSKAIAHSQTPEALFDYDWAIETLDAAMKKLADHSAAKGKSKQFEVLKCFLHLDRQVSVREASVQLGISEVAVRAAVYRLKAKLAEFVRSEVSHTLDSDDDIESEISELRRCLNLRQ